MAELMFRCSLFLVFLISSLFGKSCWWYIGCRDLILDLDPKEDWGSMWVLRICLDESSTFSPAVVQLSEEMAMEFSSPWNFSFVFIIKKKPCNILYLFFFFKKTKIKNDRKWAVSVRIKQDTQNKWSLGCLSKLPPPDQIFIYFQSKLFLCW